VTERAKENESHTGLSGEEVLSVKNYLKIYLITVLLTIISSAAMADFLPGIITIQDKNSRIIGYITSNGEIMDGDYNMVGMIREDGRIEGSNSCSIGYFDGGKFHDENFNPIGFFRGNRVENSNFSPVGYIQEGRIETRDYQTAGYFTGDTGGKDWIIAAFCIYYTDMFRHSEINKHQIKK